MGRPSSGVSDSNMNDFQRCHDYRDVDPHGEPDTELKSFTVTGETISWDDDSADEWNGAGNIDVGCDERRSDQNADTHEYNHPPIRGGSSAGRGQGGKEC